MERDAYQRNLLHFFEKKRTFYIYMVCLHQKLPDLRWFVVIVQLFIKRWVSCSLLLCQMFRFSEVQAPCCPSNFAAWILFFSSTHMIFISWQDGEGGVWFGKRKKRTGELPFFLCSISMSVSISGIFFLYVFVYFLLPAWMWIVVLYPFINWAFRWPILWWQRSNGWEVAEHSWGWDTICWSNRANLGMEVMHERNAHNFPLDLAALEVPSLNG